MKKLMLILIVVLLLMLAFAGPVFAGPTGEDKRCARLVEALYVARDRRNPRVSDNILEVMGKFDCEDPGQPPGGE